MRAGICMEFNVLTDSINLLGLATLNYYIADKMALYAKNYVLYNYKMVDPKTDIHVVKSF